MSSSGRKGRSPPSRFEPLDHVALIEKNDWADLARITQVAGSRTYCLKGRLALLEQALMLWAQKRLAADGFTLMTVPALARPHAFVATGHFPGHEEEAYHMPADDLYLAGTGEIALTSLHSGEIIEADKLPILYAGYSPCFRREAGSAGRDVRGLLRVHQFFKLEQYVICRDDDEESVRWHAAAARQCRRDAAGAGNPLSGDRGLDRRHGQRQVPDERHRDPGCPRSANIARPTAARRCTTGRRAARTCAGATRSGRSASSTPSTTPLWRPRACSCPCWKTTRPADGRVKLPEPLRELMGGDYL